MKILYLINSNGDASQHGVYKKVLHEKECFEKLGHEVKLIVFHTSPIGFPKSDAEFISLNDNNNSILGKISSGRKLNKMVIEAAKNEKPDIIYFRDRGAILNFFDKLSEIAPVFVEVQSNVIEENKVTNKKRYMLEAILKRSYYKSVTAFVCITNELYKNEIRYNDKPGFILGNGILKEDLGFAKKKDINDKINLIFVISPGLPWHGTERLIRSFNNAPNKDKFVIHIVGEEDRFGVENDQIKFYGVVNDKQKLDDLFKISDIGVGTLALYTKNMKEAAPLKVRHYIAKGLPVIIAYDDVDITDSKYFVLKFANDDTDLDFISIEQFYKRTNESRRNGDISLYATEDLLWMNKIKQLNYFISSIYGIDTSNTLRSNIDGDNTDRFKGTV